VLDGFSGRFGGRDWGMGILNRPGGVVLALPIVLLLLGKFLTYK
jgi:hypothetical protein